MYSDTNDETMTCVGSEGAEQRNSIFLCSHGSTRCSHGHATLGTFAVEWDSDDEDSDLDDWCSTRSDISGDEPEKCMLDASTQTLTSGSRPGSSRQAAPRCYYGDISDVCERSWVDMVEEQELMEDLEKRGICRKESAQNWNGPKMTVLQQIRLAWIGRNYKLPCAIWHHLKAIVQSHPTMMNHNFEACMNRFAGQSQVVMKRALLRLERYQLSRFRNVWDLLHVCLLHAMHEV